MEIFEINFDNPHSVYHPGQNVTGTVRIRNQNALNALSLKICVHGEAEVQWKKFKNSTKFDRQGKLQVLSEHVNYKSQIIYLAAVSKPWSSLDGSNKIPPGDNIFPFFFPLPANCPPSFQGHIGKIQYAVHIELDRPWRINAECKKVFSVIPIFDLMMIPKAINPMEGHACKHFGIFGTKEVKMNVRIPKRGYVPNETIPITLIIDNHAKKPISSAKASLIQHVHYTAQQEHSHLFPKEHDCHKRCEHRTGQVTVAETFRSVKVQCCSKQEIHLQVTVPPNAIPSFKIPIIEADYILKVKLEEKLECEFPIVVGTVPIVSFINMPTVPSGTIPTYSEVTVGQPITVGTLEPPPEYGSANAPEMEEEWVVKC